MAPVTLVPMTVPEFDDYLDKSIRNYAAEKIRAGAWLENDAYRLATEQFDKLLPQGIDTVNQHLYSVTDAARRNRVGIIWVGVKDRSPVPGAWIWDIMIFEQYRRKGYASETLRALDRALSSMNIHSVSLHVFGHNAPAISLYQNSGFRTMDITMTKSVTR